jgi:GT2 family glycosyltransferase
MTVSVLLPTTGRPDRAEKCVRSLIETSGDHELELIVAVDADWETVQQLWKIDSHPGVRWKLSWSLDYRGCSRAWNDALKASTGDPVVFAADDLIFEDGWLDESLRVLAEFEDGWGLVGFNDGHWDAELSTHYLMSRRFIVEVLGGVVAWDFYRHSFNDLEVNERARRAGRYAWAPHAHVRHDHWIFGDRPQDETDTRTLDQHGSSEAKYKEREAAGFPSDYPPIITS